MVALGSAKDGGVYILYTHLPILVDEVAYGICRHDRCKRLKESGFLAWWYFYPLISEFEMYRELSSADRNNFRMLVYWPIR